MGSVNHLAFFAVRAPYKLGIALDKSQQHQEIQKKIVTVIFGIILKKSQKILGPPRIKPAAAECKERKLPVRHVAPSFSLYLALKLASVF